MNELLGKVIKSIKGIQNDCVYIETVDGDCFSIYHSQGCCESVSIYDTVGNLDDVIGSPITLVDVDNADPNDVNYQPCDSYTWTIYTFETEKGQFQIRWLGESNGYYSETPYFVRSHAEM